jgi:hypothetical protein
VSRLLLEARENFRVSSRGCPSRVNTILDRKHETLPGIIELPNAIINSISMVSNYGLERCSFGMFLCLPVASTPRKTDSTAELLLLKMDLLICSLEWAERFRPNFGRRMCRHPSRRAVAFDLIRVAMACLDTSARGMPTRETGVCCPV